jgi:hypothetical protein
MTAVPAPCHASCTSLGATRRRRDTIFRARRRKLFGNRLPPHASAAQLNSNIQMSTKTKLASRQPLPGFTPWLSLT